MDAKAAVLVYQFAERAKSSLIISSQLSFALASFPEGEKDGGKRMLILLLESVRSELEFALRSTGERGFQFAIDRLSGAISLVEGMDLGAAAEMMAKAISEVTTAAAKGWQALQEHGIF